MNQYITGAVIKELREKNNLTQSELAAILNVSDKAVVILLLLKLKRIFKFKFYCEARRFLRAYTLIDLMQLLVA